MLQNCGLTVEQEKEVGLNSRTKFQRINLFDNFYYQSNVNFNQPTLIFLIRNQVLGLAMTKGRLKRVTLDQGHPQNEALFKLVAQKICLTND